MKHAPVNRQTTSLRASLRFHGWRIVLVGFFADFVNAGTSGYALSVLLVPMTDDLGWSRTALIGAVTARFLASGLMGPLVGPLLDRPGGARLVVTVGAVVGGAGMILVSTAHALWQFYLFFSIMGALLSSSSSQLVGYTIISKWFVRKRGRAMALATTGISASGVVMVPLITAILVTFGWRAAWLVLGGLPLLVLAPTAALWMRRRPEDMGLLPDGDSPPAQAPGNSPAKGTPRGAPQEVAWSRGEALRTRALWLIFLTFNFGLMGIIAILLHQVAYLRDQGFSANEAALVTTVVALFALFGKIFWGFLAERFVPRYLVTMCAWGCVVGIVLLLQATSMAWALGFALLYGLGMGGWAPLQGIIWAGYFGRGFLGTIIGTVAPLGLAISAFAPLFASFLFEASNGYTVPFTLLLVLWGLAGGAILLAKPPRKRPQKDPAVLGTT